MGRPLKIAKAQFIGIITATTATTNVVTFSPATSSTATFTIGMPIVSATSVGNIVAGTTYWVLTLPSTTSMTLSATSLDANRDRTSFPLSTTTVQTVPFTVGAVDTGFNNPNGLSNTYGVVGGNTGIVGNQVLARIAIGVAGVGTIESTSGNTKVYGIGTDFANTAAAGASIFSTTAGLLGFSASVAASISVTATTITTNVVTVSDNTGLVLNKPIVFSESIGNIIAGIVYYVKSINIDGVSITISATSGGAVFVLATAASITCTALQDTVTLVAISPATVTTTDWVHAKDEAGYLIRQKGRSKFLVEGLTTGLIGPCFTANVANAALTANTMSITATDAGSATIYIDRLSDHNADGFGNVTTALPYTVTFNTAQVANATPGQPFPIVTINAA